MNEEIAVVAAEEFSATVIVVWPVWIKLTVRPGASAIVLLLEEMGVAGCPLT